MRQLYTVRAVDFRPVDYDSGKRLALPREAMKDCECCGKKISRGAILNNGALVGLECESALSLMHMLSAEQVGASAKQADYWQRAAQSGEPTDDKRARNSGRDHREAEADIAQSTASGRGSVGS